MTIALRQRPLARVVQGIVQAAAGCWLDPSDMTTLYQDAAGTTPVTAVEQPVGLMLDKSRGLMLGPELVSNGTFDSDTGWTKSGTWAISGGVASATTESGTTYQNAGLQAGKCYKFTFEIKSASAGVFAVGVGGNTISYWKSSVGVYTGFGYTNGNPNIELKCSGFTGTIDNISVRELYGNHATQSVTASRPTLSARYNLLTKTEDFADSVWAKNSVEVQTDVAIAPNGTMSADRMWASSGAIITGNDSVGQVGNVTVASKGAPYTLSFYAKAKEINYIRVRESANTGARVKINLTDGSFSGENGWNESIFTVKTSSAENGFLRIEMTRTAPVTFSLSIKCGNDVGAGISESVYIWGADLRLGTNPGPYQRVNTATDYDTDERYFKKYLRFDGVDDYLNLPYMGLYANGSASVVMGISRAKTGAVKYAITEGNPAGGKNYIPFRLSDTGVSSRIVNDAGTVVVLTPESAGSASSLPEILSFKDTGNTLTLHKNSSQTNLTNYTRAGSLTLNNLTVGAIVQASVTENMLANLYGLIITKSAITDAQRIKCERYLATKAGLSL